MAPGQIVAVIIYDLLQVLLRNTTDLTDPATGKPLTMEFMQKQFSGIFNQDFPQEKTDWALQLGRRLAADDQFWDKLPELLLKVEDDEEQRVGLIQANQRMKSQGLPLINLTASFNAMRTPKEDYRLSLQNALDSLDNLAGT